MTPSSPEPRVLVTGGASGIGAALTHHFLAKGARVGVLDTDRDALERCGATETGIDLAIEADVSDPQDVARAFGAVDEAWGGIDVLCNNAGISVRESFLDISYAAWERTLAVNLTGVFLVGQAAARRMHAAGSGVIINTASVSGLVGMPHYAAYNASKAGVIELTRTMALELAPVLRVNSVCPGYVLTPMQRREYTEQEIADCARRIPARRLADPAEIAGLVGYLASPQAAFVTGQNFVIDGGESAGGLASG